MIEIAQQLSKELVNTTETFSDSNTLYITFFYVMCPSDGPDEEVCVLHVKENSIKIIDVLRTKRHHLLYVEEYAEILLGAVKLIDQVTVGKQEKLGRDLDKAIRQAKDLLAGKE